MPTTNSLADIFLTQWLGIRAMTYDYLDMLESAHLALTLPFPESRSLGYQFWCMTGAHESYLKELEYGEWQGFSCSLDKLKPVTPAIIKKQMQLADARMADLLKTVDLVMQLKNGKHAYEVVQRMIEHEMHHQGQLINFLFCHHLPIPPSWHAKWALAYDD
jgi:hypothetical protein